jgi:hypothetical protein
MLCRALGVGAIPSMLYEGSEKYYLFDSWICDQWLYRKLSCIESFPYIVWIFIPLLSGNEWGYWLFKCQYSYV